MARRLIAATWPPGRVVLHETPLKDRELARGELASRSWPRRAATHPGHTAANGRRRTRCAPGRSCYGGPEVLEMQSIANRPPPPTKSREGRAAAANPLDCTPAAASPTSALAGHRAPNNPIGVDFRVWGQRWRDVTKSAGDAFRSARWAFGETSSCDGRNIVSARHVSFEQAASGSIAG